MKKLIAAAVSFLLLTASATYGATYACVKKKGGNVRIISATARCLKSERKISWPDAAEFAALQAQNTTLGTQVSDLQALLQHFSRNGNDISITGANLWIKNGLGSTTGGDPDAVNGVGNLIIGYNESRAEIGRTDERTGSHNLVIGKYHNYLRYGGMVVGEGNTISAPFASVSGGEYNTASAYASSVSGGYNNTASGLVSSVSGGYENDADGDSASVSGGYQNHASGDYSSVSGGAANAASGDYSSVSGGWNNTASGNRSSLSGGVANTASAYASSVSGGFTNIASGEYSSVSGGALNSAGGNFSSTSGGLQRDAPGEYDWRGGAHIENQ